MSQAPTKSLPMNLYPICEEHSWQVFRFLESEMYHIHLDACRLRLPGSSTTEDNTFTHVPLLPTYPTSSEFTLFPGSAEPAPLPSRARGKRGCLPILWSTINHLAWNILPLRIVKMNSHATSLFSGLQLSSKCPRYCLTITLRSEPLNSHHNHRHADVSLCN